MSDEGALMYQWATDLFPICRSLTGRGVRQTLEYFQQRLPELKIIDIPSGTQAFDWTVPDEWNIVDAFVATSEGHRVIDFRRNNLHVIGYSEPVDRQMSFEELDQHLHSLPHQPDAIPYLTSYYKRRWGFCLTENQRQEMRRNADVIYHVKIDATLKPGNLTYGELIIPGESEQEVLLSSYVCHPSMGNNELSGPCVAAALAQWIEKHTQRRYTYRILFLVETIGSVVYLSRHLETMKRNTLAGFVLTCIGDDRAYSYVPSRYGQTLVDRVALHVLSHHAPDFKPYTFLERGSDERQYCSPGVDLPVCSIMRSKYDTYPEYHTSLDDLSLISAEGLKGGFEVLRKCISLLEANNIYRCTVPCEPQLGKRGLYPSLSTKETYAEVLNIVNLLAYADGTEDLLAIAERIGVYFEDLIPLVDKLTAAGLLETIG
jgi:aminopeptidase-like protein